MKIILDFLFEGTSSLIICIVLATLSFLFSVYVRSCRMLNIEPMQKKMKQIRQDKLVQAHNNILNSNVKRNKLLLPRYSMLRELNKKDFLSNYFAHNFYFEYTIKYPDDTEISLKIRPRKIEKQLTRQHKLIIQELAILSYTSEDFIETDSIKQICGLFGDFSDKRLSPTPPTTGLETKHALI